MKAIKKGRTAPCFPSDRSPVGWLPMDGRWEQCAYVRHRYTSPSLFRVPEFRGTCPNGRIARPCLALNRIIQRFWPTRALDRHEL